MSLHSIVLALHNIGRWAVLALALYALYRAGSGLLAKGGWLPADDKARRLFPIAMDIQFTLGILLHAVLTPLGRDLVTRPGEVMGNSIMRFYAVEHVIVALAAMAFAHIGSVRIRKATVARDRFKTMLIFYGLALVLILARMPWDRPLFPGL